MGSSAFRFSSFALIESTYSSASAATMITKKAFSCIGLP